MLRNVTCFQQIYIATGYTDLRLGVDGLATLIHEKFNISPFQEDVLFLFCGKKNSRIKGLVWEGDGFLLLIKRIECGRFRWPRSVNEVKELTQTQFEWLMSGLEIESSIRKIEPKQIF